MKRVTMKAAEENTKHLAVRVKRRTDEQCALALADAYRDGYKDGWMKAKENAR